MILSTNEKKWILIVDDDENVIDSLTDLIELNFGKTISVVKARDGLEGTSKINNQRFDCIITDLKMPRKIGEAFIHSVRQTHLNELTPIVILSGSTTLIEVAKGLNFVNTVEKPYKMQDMVNLIKTNLDLKTNKNRISAEVFNNLVSGVDSFVSGLTHESLTQKGSVCRKAKDFEVPHDFASSIQFKIGVVYNTFSLLVHKNDLDRLKKKMTFDSPKSAEEIMHSMSYVIIKYVMEKSDLNQREKFNANSIVHNRDIITAKQGLILQLENDSFSIGIFAASQQ